MGNKNIRELTDFQFAGLLTLPVFLFMFAVIFYPLIYSVMISFSNVSFFGGFSMNFVGLKNFIALFNDPGFWHSVKVSLRFTVGSVVITLLVGLSMALILNNTFRARNLIRSIAILPWAVSYYGVGVMFSYLLRGRTGIFTAFSYLFGFNESIDLLSGPLVVEMLAVAHAWNLAPLVAFFLLANLETIPRRLYDLADLDNLNFIEKFRIVTLPYIRYTLYVFAAISTVFSLRVFDLIFIQTGGGPGMASATLTYMIYRETFRNLNLGYGAATALVLLLILLASTLLLYQLVGRKEG